MAQDDWQIGYGCAAASYPVMLQACTARISLRANGRIWGAAFALHECTEIDPLRARYVNDNPGDYLIAVNADVPRVDMLVAPRIDAQVNPLGVKGVGELANVGVAAAVATPTGQNPAMPTSSLARPWGIGYQTALSTTPACSGQW